MTTTLNLLAYAMLSTFIVMRLVIKKRSKSALVRSIAMLTLILVASGDLLWVMCSPYRSTTVVVQVFNVVLILFFVRAIREVWIQFLQVVVKSVPVFAIIFAYFILYILTGFIFFANSELSEDFSTINNAMYTVFILFTVSNYPDVQTPYFE